ncbi:hypothetical protein ACQKB2_17855 [Mycobacterium tuberculosis]
MVGRSSGLHAVPGGLNIPQNAIPLTIDASGVLDPITIFPGGFTIDPLPPSLALNISGRTQRSDHHRSADARLRERDRHPSSGFFNSGAGGVSGFRQRGRQLRLVEPGACRVGGRGLGVLNVGTLNSGVLNVGSGISGLYNTAIVVLGTPALGAGNVGQQLSGCWRPGRR